MGLPACPNLRPCEQGDALLVGLITTLGVREAFSKGRLGSTGPGQHSTSVHCSQQEADVLHSSSIPLLFSTFIARLQCAWQNDRGDTWSLTAQEEMGGAWEEEMEMWFFCQQHTGASPRSS